MSSSGPFTDTTSSEAGQQVLSRAQNILILSKIAMNSEVNPQTLISLLCALKTFIYNLPPQDPQPVVSLVTRKVIYQTYAFLLQAFWNTTTARQRRTLKFEFSAVLRSVHHKFHTVQVGSYFDYPQ